MSLTSYRDLSRYSTYSMPGETRASRNTQPRSTNSSRGTSLERSKAVSTSLVSSSSKSLPRSSSRPLPPGPLDEYGRKLKDFNPKTRASPTGSTLRNGPIKADFSGKSTYSRTYNDAMGSSAKAKSPQNENFGVSATPSSTLRRGSSSISSLTDSTKELKLNGGRSESYVTPRSKDSTNRSQSRKDSFDFSNDTSGTLWSTSTKELKLNGGRSESYVTPRSKDSTNRSQSRKDSFDFSNDTSGTLWSTSSRRNETSVQENGVSAHPAVGRPPPDKCRGSSSDLSHDSNSSNNLSVINTWFLKEVEPCANMGYSEEAILSIQRTNIIQQTSEDEHRAHVDNEEEGIQEGNEDESYSNIVDSDEWRVLAPEINTVQETIEEESYSDLDGYTGRQVKNVTINGNTVEDESYSNVVDSDEWRVLVSENNTVQETIKEVSYTDLDGLEMRNVITPDNAVVEEEQPNVYPDPQQGMQFNNVTQNESFNMNGIRNTENQFQKALAFITSFLKGTKQKIINLDRRKILELVDYYKDSDMSSCCLIVEFENDCDADSGVLTKDAFNMFWKEAYIRFFKGEDAVVPSLSMHRRHEAESIYMALGRIFCHMLSLIGTLPHKLCRSGLLSIVYPGEKVDEELLLNDFLLYISLSERLLLNQFLNSCSWEALDKEKLFDFLSAHGMHVRPTPKNLKSCILNMAYSELLDKPMYLYTIMRRGFSDFYMGNFFSIITPKDLVTFMGTWVPSTEQIISSISVDDVLRPEQQTVLYHLKTFIREMSQQQLETFLSFATGSPFSPDGGIQIIFNRSDGLSRCPTAHTCGNVLELPTTYLSYQDFKQEFSNILSNDESFRMTVM